jgi:hypothetical protein
LLSVRQLRAKRLLPGNLLSAVVVLLLLAPSTYLGVTRFKGVKRAAPPSSRMTADAGVLQTAEVENKTTGAETSRETQKGRWVFLLSSADSAAARVGMMRQNFVVSYPDSNSTIDGDVTFKDAADVIRYLPRACAIGFFAPFPDTWFAKSPRVGATGKLISALETLIVYVVQILAVVGLFQSRRSLSAWLLFLIAAIGVTTLGLVVANVGALYRQRYVFWFLFIILGARGLIYVSSLPGHRRRIVPAT